MYKQLNGKNDKSRRLNAGDIVVCPYGVGVFTGNVQAIDTLRHDEQVLVCYGVVITDPAWSDNNSFGEESFWLLDSIYLLRNKPRPHITEME